MNAVISYIDQRQRYVRERTERLVTQFSRDPDKRAEALSQLGHDLVVSMALCLKDDAELGRVVKEAFWREIVKLAEEAAEQEYIDREDR